MADQALSVTVPEGLDAAQARVRAALAEQGFGILTEIDVSATMRAKLGAELSPYLILGACNPPLALRALTVDPSIGLLLPCNVVVRAVDEDTTLVEAMDPRLLVDVTGDPRLAEVAAQARELLAAAMSSLATAGRPS